MSINDDVELLRRIPMFAKVEPAKLKLLAFTSERVTYSEGQDLFRQGDNSDAAYIIVEGTADVIVNSPKGPLTVAKLDKNEFIGDIGILCDVPRTATVRAATQLTTLKITKELFFRMVTDFPTMGVEVMRVLAHRLELTTAQLAEAKSRVA
jgi:CRP/FNR family transcriptional regulator, cyclic AMP receptor protein